MITVKEVMTTELVTLKQSDSIKDARKIMSEKGIRHIPVVGEQGELIGIVTQRDVLRAGSSCLNENNLDENNEQLDDSKVQVQKIMSDQVSLTHPKESLRVAGLELQRQKYGCLPVVEKNKLVGIITDSDFVGVAIDLIEHMDFAEDADF